MLVAAKFCSGHDVMLNGYSSHLAYIPGTQSNHAWSKLKFNTYFEHIVIIYML